jgi:pyruvate, water dikinase
VALAKPPIAEVRRGQVDDLTDRSQDGVLWSRVNTAEAAPGVMTPMTWTYYVYLLEVAARAGFVSMGIIPPAAGRYPMAVKERMFGCFHGRCTGNVTVVRKIFGSLPGVSGDEVERDLLGSSREGVADDPYPFRLPFVLARLSVIVLRRRREPARNHDANERWWRASVEGSRLRQGLDARTMLQESLARFEATLEYQAWQRMLMQTVSGGLLKLAQQAGRPEAHAALLGGDAGTVEAVVADDLWSLARGELTLEPFLADHGYHGPNAGDPASRVWREDPRAVERLLGPLAEAESPRDRRLRSAAEQARTAREFVESLPAAKRLPAQALVRLAPVAARGLEQNKTAFLIAVDVGRAAVRDIGRELAANGLIDEPEDAFHLFADELLASGRDDLRELAAQRRALHERCKQLEVPETWEGQPQVGEIADVPQSIADRLSGLGVSAGVYEGTARVVIDVNDEIALEPGEVLVCATTDPSWVALMTLAGALVIDIGAAASHGAVVARELGVPCVIGTGSGTRALRDGDRVRVDGSAGVVDVLARG